MARFLRQRSSIKFSTATRISFVLLMNMQPVAGLVVVFAFPASQAPAQITDPDQRMRWFNLQRLAIETNKIEAYWGLGWNGYMPHARARA
jgi:hypothetical protein